MINPSTSRCPPGDPATFSTSVTGLGLKYQWRKNGVNIPGATSSAYHIDAVTLKSAGTYSVVITNFTGSKTKQWRKAGGCDATSHRDSTSHQNGCAGQSTYLAAVVTGTLSCRGSMAEGCRGRSGRQWPQTDSFRMRNPPAPRNLHPQYFKCGR